MSVDPLYEMFPGVSPYAYVLNNPIRYTDPTGMAAENSDDCGIGCTLRKVFNSILYPGGVQNPDGTLSRKKYRATGWDITASGKNKKDEKEKNEKNETNETKSKPRKSIVSNLSIVGINPQTFIPQVDMQLPNLNPITSLDEIIIGGRKIDIGFEPQSVDFNFSTVGDTASRSTDGLRTGTNHILPLTNSQQQNLQAIANYLITHPNATVRFQYPTPGSDFHPAAANDLREVYQMNFSQMTNYLIQQGVTDPNRRVLMDYGTGFDFFVNPGN